MDHIRLQIKRLARFQFARRLALDLQRQRALKLIVKLLSVGVDVPGH